MAVTSARNIVNLKEKGHFEPENTRIDKYTLADELPKQLTELNIRKRTSEKPSYKIQKITPRDKERMIKFLQRFFFRDEPMNLAVDLLEEPNSRCAELEEYAASTLEQGVSVAAVDEANGEYVGVIINGIVRRQEAEKCQHDNAKKCGNPKFKRVLKVLEHLDQQARIWDKLPEGCDVVLEVRIASTHSEWRGRGLMRVLCEESERLARSIGACALRMDTTSAFSATVAERLCYKEIYGTRYADLSYAPQPKYPHLEARVYIKKLEMEDD